MAKALKIIGTVAVIGGLALVTGGAALGLSFGSMLTTSIAGLGISAGALISAGTLINAAGSLMSARAKAPATSSSASDRLNVSMNLRAPRVTVVGSTAMATDLRDQEWSDDQSLCHRFVVVAAHRVQAIREIWFDGELAWTAAGGVQGKGVGYLTVIPILEGTAGNAINIGPRMGRTRIYAGCAYVYLAYKLTGNGKKGESPYAQSIPSRVTIVGDGASFYDPRRDSTVPGGSGTMRAGDQSTWAWDASACRNPALATLFYLLGWRINGRLSVGKGIPASRIDLASFIAAANICDEPVAKPGGGFEPRYRCDGVWNEEDDPSLVLDNLKAAMNAVLDDVDGKIRLTVLHNDLVVPAGDLTTDDVLGEFTWIQTPALDESINVIRGGYTDPSPASLYQLVDYPEVRIDSPDGIDRSQLVNLPLVQSPSQGQRLVKLRLGRSQYGGTFTAVFQATAWKYQKGDVVRFSFLPLGWSQKLFRIADMAVQVDGTVPLMLREEHPAIYAAYDDATAAVTGVAPTTYDPSLWPVLQAIDEAGKTGDWSQIVDDNGKKPEDSATVGAPADTPVGDLTGKLVADAMKAMSDGVDVSDVVEGARDVAAEARQAAAAARELTGAAKGDIAAAVAGARDLVTAGRGNATAALANQLLQQARKDRFEQLAHLDGLPMGTVVKREVIERKEGEAQIVGTIELIGHKTEDAEGFILNTQTVMVAPGQSLGEKFTAIIAEVAGPDGPIQAVVTELTQAIADEKEARALALQDLKVEIVGPDGTRLALATDLLQAIADQDEARVQALLDLKAEIEGPDGTRLALATDLLQAIADQDEARVQALLDLKAEIEGPDGTRVALATDLLQAVADQDEARALALTDLRTEIVGPDGPVTAINTRLDEAFSGEEGSFARSIMDLESEVGNQKASVELLLETVNGETANAQLVTNVNGHITGFRINGQESLFFVAAERFVVGEDQVFEVINGETRTKNLRVGGDLVIDGSLKIGKLDRSTMSSYSQGEAIGFFGGFNTGLAYVPNLGASMPIGDAGTLYLSFTGYSGNTNSAITANYNSIEILDAAGAVLQSVRLPYSVNNRLENYLVRIPNTWGARTIQWRVATRGNDQAYSNINDPNVTVNWSML